MTSTAMASQDPGLRAALAAAGGLRALARRLGVRHGAVQKWGRIPRERVMSVAAATGLAAEALRPDLVDWFYVQAVKQVAAEVENRWREPTVDEGLLDVWAAVAAALFVSRERRLASDRVFRGRRREEEEARALAMGLALVVGRARATCIAGVFGCSRQNVTNAAERYLRARDGDDPDDYIGGADVDGKARVLEVGRLRLAKTADPDLWALQQRFEAFLAGAKHSPADQLQRRRA